MKRYRYWLIVGLLWFGAAAYAQEQIDADYVQAVTADLRQKTGKTPQPKEIVDALTEMLPEFTRKATTAPR